MKTLNCINLHKLSQAKLAKREEFLCLLLLLCGGCNSKPASNNESNTIQQAEIVENTSLSEKGISIIDVANVPDEEQKVFLQDVAEVSYIPLETNDSVLLEGIRNFTITDNYILAHNKKEGSIILFNNKGKIISSFNHKGSSGKEYTYCSKVTFDEEKKEIYVVDDIRRKQILTYDYNGKFLRSIPTSFSAMDGLMNVNDKWLFYYDIASSAFFNKKDSLSNYRLINKVNGSIEELPIKPKVEQTNTIRKKDGRVLVASYSFPYFRNGKEILLADLACDTIYSLEEHVIKPRFVKKNAHRNLLATPYLRTQHYLYLYLTEKDENTETFIHTKILAHNLITSENSNIAFYNRDDEHKPVTFCNVLIENRIQNCGISFYSADRLIERNEEGKLKGELQQIASNVESDDNPILMIVKFKK